MQDEIGDLVVFIFCLLRNWALNSSTYTLLSLTNKKVSNYPLTFNGLYRAYNMISISSSYTSNPSGFIFCPEFVFNYSRLTVTFISCLCHDPLSNTKGLFSKTWYGFLVLTLFSVSWSVTLSCQHCLFNTPPLCCHSI